MISGETIKVPDEMGKEVEINKVVIFPQTNQHRTMYWTVRGWFGDSIYYGLYISTDKQKAVDYFNEINNRLLEAHERDLATRL